MTQTVLDSKSKAQIAGDVFAKEIYADLHLHPTTKPFVMPNVQSPWDAFDMASPDERKKRSIKYTQSDYGRLFRSNTRLVALNLHVPERYVFSKLFTSPALFERLWGMDVNVLRDVVTRRPFEMFQREYALFKAHLRDPHSERSVEVAQNYEHLTQILADPNKIAILLCVEGAHNLGFEFSDKKFPIEGQRVNLTNKVTGPEEINERLIDERTDFLKENHFFMITLNHFVYNGLASMAKAVELTGLKKVLHNPIRSLDNLGKYRGLTFLGYYFVERCLEKGILLDLKHCDAITRRHLYTVAQKYNRPLIASHVGVSGRKTNFSNHKLLNSKEDAPRDRFLNHRFNPWDINLHDDDVIAIHASGGLMGLILDERILGGAKAVRLARKNGKWVELLYYHIEHIFQVLTNAGFPAAQCLDSVCLGSDFDGFIDPIDDVTSADDLRFLPDKDHEAAVKLDTGLLELFRARYNIYKKTGLSPEEIVMKIMSKNVHTFLARWFH